MKNLLAFASLSLFLSTCAGAQEVLSPADLLSQKINQRLDIISKASKTPRKIQKEGNDLVVAAYFLEKEPSAITTDIRQLESLRSVRINSSMWTGYFWPNYQGGLGHRTADSNFPKADWGQAHNYILSHGSDTITNDSLSPSEKYDIVMGVSPEEDGSLTKQQWSVGAQEYASTGRVQTWQGICHGWPPASINLAVPWKPVLFSTRRGNITFNSNDIKALGSLLYANGKFESSYVGFRCNTDSPRRERDGRNITPECFDVNPADWHIITTHHIGYDHRPFIVDMLSSTQVWNKPIIGYSYAYYDVRNPGRMTYNLNEAITRIEDARRLRFGTHRSPKAVWVVGITMTITHLEGGLVDVGMTNTKNMSYRYDLELDSAMRIVGGEWQDDNHPDFAWKPRYLNLPVTDGDSLTNPLTPWEAAVDKNWRTAALKSNAQGAPLTKFVKYLFDFAGSAN